MMENRESKQADWLWFLRKVALVPRPGRASREDVGWTSPWPGQAHALHQEQPFLGQIPMGIPWEAAFAGTSSDLISRRLDDQGLEPRRTF